KTRYLCLSTSPVCVCCFFFNDTATTEIYTLSLHDALPISSRPLGLHYTRVDALADCRYCLPDVRGQPESYRHSWHPQGVPACHSDWGALRWLHTRHPSLADTTQASHNRQCHCSAVSRPQGL